MTMSKRTVSHRAAGFTLPELLVGIAIFVSVMAGIVLLFNAAVRTVRQGHQSQQAFELARGTLGVLERDLTRAFTSRAHGDYYQFYGTPIGFSFVGMVEVGGLDQIARVTYVIYGSYCNDPGRGIIDPNIPRAQAAQLAALPTLDTFQMVPRQRDEDQEDVSETAVTFNLLRYIEPDAEDLDSFPVEWKSIPAGLPESGISLAGVIQTQLDQAVFELNEALFDGDGNRLRRWDDPALPDRFKQVVESTKRQLWIRMLAGGDRTFPQGIAGVPDAWGPDGPLYGLDPCDYIVAEDIRFVSTAGEFAVRAPTIMNPNDSGNFGDGRPLLTYNGQEPFFQYKRTGFREATSPLGGFVDESEQADEQFLLFWNELFATGGDVVANAGGNPLRPRIPESVRVRFNIVMPSSFPGAPDFDRVFEKTMDVVTGFTRNALPAQEVGS